MLPRFKKNKPVKSAQPSPQTGTGNYGVIPPEPAKCSFWELKNRDSGNDCKNCGEEVTGKYCSECGQKRSTKRFVFRTIFQNFLNAVFNVERGIFKTALMLFSRPGYMSRDYIEGKRVSYTNPFSLMVLLAGTYSILYLIMVWTIAEPAVTEFSSENFSVSDVWSVLHSDDDTVFGNREPSNWEIVFIRVFRWLIDSSVVLSLCLVPIYSLFIKLLFWRANRRRYNYTELMYVSAYIAAQRFIIDLLAIPFRWTLMDGGIDILWAYIGLFYFIFTVVTLRQLFGTGWIGTFFRSIGIFFFSFILVITLFVLLIGLIYWIFEGGSIFSA